MKQKKHMVVIGTLTLCGSLLVAVPSSFAAKAMDDKDMDRTTAAGQPRVDVGNGQQTINDNSLYSVSLGLDAQGAITGDSVANIAGENNVAVAINVANVDGGGTVDQLNDINQQRNSQVTIVAGATRPGLTWVDGTVSTANGDVSGDITVDNITASADHIKIGHGDQTEEDNSTYAVDITDAAQKDAVVLSMVNAAGRNNVAVAVNAANRDQSLSLGADFGAIAISQLNTIVQSN
ncbi:MAG: hypothetical protein WCS70_01970 [Verrucomicrobiota bacterium]